MVEAQRPITVQVVKTERPVGGSDAPHEVTIEHVKDVGFTLMTVILPTFMFYQLNPVPAPSLIRTGMEVSCVLITIDGRLDLAPLLLD